MRLAVACIWGLLQMRPQMGSVLSFWTDFRCSCVPEESSDLWRLKMRIAVSGDHPTNKCLTF